MHAGVPGARLQAGGVVGVQAQVGCEALQQHGGELRPIKQIHGLMSAAHRSAFNSAARRRRPSQAVSGSLPPLASPSMSMGLCLRSCKRGEPPSIQD
jgi:hypothetical protein